MNTNYRIQELEEKRDEFILNESVFADENPSWGEVVDANAIAERQWNETDDGKELKGLIAFINGDNSGSSIHIVTEENQNINY